MAQIIPFREQQPQLENGVGDPSVRDEAPDVHERLVRYVEDYEDATFKARERSERDADYYDGKQLTEEERKKLEDRGQPPLVFNKIKRKVNFMLGLEAKSRTDPRAWPRNPSEEDEEKAEAATDGIRYVCDSNRFDKLKSRVFKNLCLEGAGGAEVIVEDRNGKREVSLKRLQWDRIGWDPHSAEYDFSDARYTFYNTWMDRDAAIARYKRFNAKVDAIIESAMSDTTSLSQTFDDRPRNFTAWVDSKRRRVRIIHMYYKRDDGEWQFCIFTRAGKIMSMPSPYVNEDGQTENAMILASAYVDRENNRYGEVRELIDPQDEVNKRRSKALHKFTTRQVIATKGAVKNVDEVRRKLTEPDAYIEINLLPDNGRFEIVDGAQTAQGDMLLLQQAQAELDASGPNAALAGKGTEDQSGRAIIAQQQGGLIEIGPVYDELNDWSLRVYRAIWHRIKQFKDEEWWIRITDDERKPRFVGLNIPVTMLDMAQEQLGELAQAGQIAPEDAQARLQAFAQDPRAQQVVGVRNDVARMDVDIELTEVPDTITIQQEQFQELVGLASAGVVFPPEVYIEASSLRNKEKLIEKMKQQPETPEEAAALQQAQEFEQRNAEAEVSEKESKAELNRAKVAQMGFEAGLASVPGSEERIG